MLLVSLGVRGEKICKTKMGEGEGGSNGAGNPVSKGGTERSAAQEKVGHVLFSCGLLEHTSATSQRSTHRVL